MSLINNNNRFVSSLHNILMVVRASYSQAMNCAAFHATPPYSPVLQGPNTWRGQGQGTLVRTSLYSNCTPLACHALLVYRCKFCGTLVYGNVIGTLMFCGCLLIIFYSTIFKAHRRLYGLQDSHFWVLKLMGKSEPESKQNKGWMVCVQETLFHWIHYQPSNHGSQITTMVSLAVVFSVYVYLLFFFA